MRRIAPLLFIALFLFVYSCTTKVDLVAEGYETSIVYGFIDPTVDTQFVKITKSFAVQGNAYDSALNPDLSQYQNLEAYIIEWDDNDSITSFLLKEKVVTDKDSGVFYYPVQTVYYTDEINFGNSTDPQYNYRYEIRFTENGKKVSSRVPVVGAFIPNNSQVLPTISLVQVFNASGSIYQNKTIKITQSKNAKRYELTLRFHYTEEYVNGSQAAKYMDFKYAPMIFQNTSGNSEDDFNIDGENFFIGVASRLEAQDNEENVTKRVIGTLDYIIDYAGDDFNTFIQLSQPATSINAELNPYTNIVNGKGIWSSRGQTVFSDKDFQDYSIQELVQGQYTIDYKFCSDKPGFQGGIYGCN